MKIRLRIDVAVDTPAHAQQILNWVWNNKSWFSKISDLEPAWLRICKCYHDEDPVRPCEIQEEIINGVFTWHLGESVP